MRTMDAAPRDGTPIKLVMRDAMGEYECGPYAWKRDGWYAVGGRYESKLAGSPQGWCPDKAEDER